MKRTIGAVLWVGLLLGGCSSSDIQNKEAVRQGVIDHLSANTGLNLGSMDVEVTSVMFRENEADATVSFRPRGSAGGGEGMQMQYTLEQSGGKWVVKGKAESGGSPHGGEAPAGEAPGGELPQGHPPMGEAPPAGDMPEGHPPVGDPQ